MIDPGAPRKATRPRYQPQTGASRRCSECDQLFSPDPDDRDRRCLSCRAQPGLFPKRKAQ